MLLLDWACSRIISGRPTPRRAAYPQRRSSNANSLCSQVLAEPAGVTAASQTDSSPTDSGVRVLHAQAGSRLIAHETSTEIGIHGEYWRVNRAPVGRSGRRFT